MSEGLTIVGIGTELLGISAAMENFRIEWTTELMKSGQGEDYYLEHQRDYLDTQFWMDAEEYRQRLRTMLYEQRDVGLGL